MQYKHFLNLLRNILGSSAIVYGLLSVYFLYTNKISFNENNAIVIVLSLLGGIILAFTSHEDIIIRFKKKPSINLALFKEIILVFLWMMGILIGGIFLIVLIYAILIISFK